MFTPANRGEDMEKVEKEEKIERESKAAAWVRLVVKTKRAKGGGESYLEKKVDGVRR